MDKLIQQEKIIIICGAGEMASAVAHRLFVSGFKVGLLELPNPLCIRRTVSFSPAVYEGKCTVQGVIAKKVNNPDEFIKELKAHEKIPLLVKPTESDLNILKPDIYIDATLSKKNIKTTGNEAPLVIGLGPGFKVSKNCHLIVETNRGHFLGQVINQGEAEPDTGIPGNISGETERRVIRSPEEGIFQTKIHLGESVEKGEILGTVKNCPVIAQLNGLIRGLISNNTKVTKNMKIGDIDPRDDKTYLYTISDKGRTVSGGVLEAILGQKYYLKK